MILNLKRKLLPRSLGGCLSTSFHHNFLSTSKTSKYLKTLTSAVEDLDNNCKSVLKNLWFSETEQK